MPDTRQFRVYVPRSEALQSDFGCAFFSAHHLSLPGSALQATSPHKPRGKSTDPTNLFALSVVIVGKYGRTQIQQQSARTIDGTPAVRERRRVSVSSSNQHEISNRMMFARRLCLVFLLATACGDGARAGSLSPSEILATLGAKGRAGRTAEQLTAYRQTFGFLDADGDGGVTLEEYLENSIFPEPDSARGVFGATDRDGSGIVSMEEYVENRIITDEAKEIFSALDSNDDGRITAPEFASGSPFEAHQQFDVFRRFDTSMDGAIGQVEFLRVWGVWART